MKRIIKQLGAEEFKSGSVRGLRFVELILVEED